MESIEETCDPNDTDWKQAPLITLMDAAKAGIKNAGKELEKRQLEMARALNDLENDKLGTVTPKFSIQDDED